MLAMQEMFSQALCKFSNVSSQGQSVGNVPNPSPSHDKSSLSVGHSPVECRVEDTHGREVLATLGDNDREERETVGETEASSFNLVPHISNVSKVNSPPR